MVAVVAFLRPRKEAAKVAPMPTTPPNPPPMSAADKKKLRDAINACRAQARKNPNAPKTLRQINAFIKRARAEARAEGRLPAHVD
jgi:hypothetical protein